jgi:hypothetical protein
MHRKPQTPKPACLPACLLLHIACDYYGLDCFDPLETIKIVFIYTPPSAIAGDLSGVTEQNKKTFKNKIKQLDDRIGIRCA